jgi:6-phosphogluconate dehydrogenase
MVEAIRQALYASKICSYAQGFQLMREAQKEYNWTLNFGEIAQIFRGGCIIRAAFLQKITEAYARDPELANLLLDPYFKSAIDTCQQSWRKVIALAAQYGVSIPTFSSALSYYGAHTYERTDEARGNFYHIDWPKADRPQLKA